MKRYSDAYWVGTGSDPNVALYVPEEGETFQFFNGASVADDTGEIVYTGSVLRVVKKVDV